MARRRFTDAEKAEALELYAEVGPAEASRRTGIPKGTIASWANRQGLHTNAVANTQAATQAIKAKWAERRAQMVDEIGAVAHMALLRAEQCIAGDRPNARDAKDFATTMAILVDKAQLLGGDATERHENRQLRNQLLEQARSHAPTLRAVS